MISALSAVLQHFLDTGHALFEDVLAELLELGTLHEVAVVLIIGENFNLDLSRFIERKTFLGLHTRCSESVHGTLVVLDINAAFDGLGLVLEVFAAEIDKHVVDVFTTEMGVAIGGLDRDTTIFYGKEGNIEGSAAEVEDQNDFLLLGLIFEAVRHGSGGRLVDDSEDVETRIGGGFFGGLALRIVEVSGDGDDSLRDCPV